MSRIMILLYFISLHVTNTIIIWELCTCVVFLLCAFILLQEKKAIHATVIHFFILLTQCKVNKKRLFSGNMASSRKKSTKLSFLLLFLLLVKPGELNPGSKRPNLYGITLLYTILKKQNALMRIIQSISFIQSAFLNVNWIHSFHLLNKT